MGIAGLLVLSYVVTSVSAIQESDKTQTLVTNVKTVQTIEYIIIPINYQG